MVSELGNFFTKNNADGSRSVGFVVAEAGDEVVFSVHYRLGPKLYDVLRPTLSLDISRRLRRIPQTETRWDYARKGR